ncbi:hypothetical protein GOP47_0013514 [Adiantum capillus-veneris]|uniref:Cupin-like domain-containing protein n=1 Tax=Adiantum capillus-veneris TaxID=13818 RepID=A0A9D4UNN5_ADICA|nr:hypothetical protein GOP47_0013514 [Adiantum capillus-veneris]
MLDSGATLGVSCPSSSLCKSFKVEAKKGEWLPGLASPVSVNADPFNPKGWIPWRHLQPLQLPYFSGIQGEGDCKWLACYAGLPRLCDPAQHYRKRALLTTCLPIWLTHGITPLFRPCKACKYTETHLPWATEALGCLPKVANPWIRNEKAVTSFHKDQYENLYAVVHALISDEPEEKAFNLEFHNLDNVSTIHQALTCIMQGYGYAPTAGLFQSSGWGKSRLVCELWKSRNLLWTVWSSEPLVSSAAAEAIRCLNGSRRSREPYTSLVNVLASGWIDRGFTGELVAKIILLEAEKKERKVSLASGPQQPQRVWGIHKCSCRVNDHTCRIWCK